MALHPPVVDLSTIKPGPGSPLHALKKQLASSAAPRTRKNKQHEGDAQSAIIAWADSITVNPEYKSLRWLFAVPNAARRSKKTGALLKRQGMRKGVSDLLLLEARGGYFGLLLELKLEGRSRTAEQIDFAQTHAARGYRVMTIVVAPDDITEAQHAIMMYLALPRTTSSTPKVLG